MPSITERALAIIPSKKLTEEERLNLYNQYRKQRFIDLALYAQQPRMIPQEKEMPGAPSYLDQKQLSRIAGSFLFELQDAVGTTKIKAIIEQAKEFGVNKPSNPRKSGILFEAEKSIQITRESLGRIEGLKKLQELHLFV